MSFVTLCDLCGKPVGEAGSGHRMFKIKEASWCFTGWNKERLGWREIDCHQKCIERLFGATAAINSPIEVVPVDKDSSVMRSYSVPCSYEGDTQDAECSGSM